MAFELDHLFVCASPGAPEAEGLIAYGLTEGPANTHPGQGTANRRFFFHNAMLELLWVTDEREVRSALVAPTRLWERSRFRHSGASPFGLCLRPAGTDTAALPFPTWSYRPPYLPPGQEILVAQETSPAEPMLFVLPFRRQPAADPSADQPPRHHPRGAQKITAVKITVPTVENISLPWSYVNQMAIATITPGDEHLMELTFDGAQRGDVADLRPALPLVLRSFGLS